MVGDAIKFEPAWILSNKVKKTLNELNCEDAIISTTGKFKLISDRFCSRWPLS
jgi:hypothetical protein